MNRFLSAVFSALVLCFVMTGCSQQQEGARDASAPIGATSRFDRDRMAGDWQLVSSFTMREQASVTFGPATEPASLAIASDGFPQITGRYREGVPGELIPFSAAQETLVVLWIDEEFRTAAIGTESGRIGIVLDRDGQISADKAAAVREIFAFYGWDASRLKGTQ